MPFPGLQWFAYADDNHFQVNKQLRGSIVVTRQNVISDPPFSKIDLISCRNLLIYLEPELQQKLLSLFHFALNENGALFLGCSESVGQRTDLFEPVSKKWRVFRRIGPARRDLVQVPILAGADYRARLSGSKLTSRSPPGFAELTQKVLLAEYAPAAVLINRKYEILSFSGPTSNYLEQPTGDPTTDLMALARPGLRTKIRAVCHKLLNGGETRAETAARVQRDGSSVDCTITARLLHVPKEAEGLLLVAFLDRPAGAQPQDTQLANSHAVGSEEESAVVRQLEYEVESTREDLQSTIEELQSSNEEVMSMNEELQSANEELESSKEELQSLNEELSTMNSQLQDKNDGLEQTNDDIRNLLNSTEIATVFLDRDLRIRRFTPATAPLLNLIETDVGRPIRDIAPKFTDSCLVQDVGRVLDKLELVETEICSDTGRWYLRRILPYRTSDNHIEGVVITFVDITQRIEAEAQSRRLATVLRDSNDAVIVHDLEDRITAWNRGAEHMYGYTEPEALERHMGDLLPEADRAAHAELVARIAQGDHQVRSFESRRLTRDGSQLDVWLTVTRLTDDRGNPIAIATTERDITDRKRKEAEIRQLTIELEDRVKQRTSALEVAMAELRRKEREFRTFADNVPALFNYVDATRRYRFVNKEYENFFRLPAQEIIGKTIEELLGSTKYKAIEPHINEVLAGKRVQFETEVEFPVGMHTVQATFDPDFDERGTIVGFFTLIYDITERKRIEDALGESERRLRAIVDSAADAIITIGEQGIIDTFNFAAERMFGYSAQEAIGQNVKILMPAPYREEHDGYLSRYLRTGEARVIGISRALIAQRKDGTTFPIEVAVSEFADATQQLFTGIVRDLSERKALQNELLTILSEEQRRIGQDLHDVVGQELTGLSLITKSLSLSLEEHRGADAKTVTRLGAGIAKTLEQIRKLSKGLIPVEIDSQGLAAALLRLSGNVSQDAGIQCDFDCEETILVGNNNTATHLYRIAQEAVANALKHGAPRRIRISLEQDKDGLILGIRDDGKGISSAAGQSEGMGLKIMQYRASLIGASLSVAAVKEGGTLVTCRRFWRIGRMGKRLPATNKHATRVLIVDDHPIVREGLSSLLSKQPDFEICGEADDVQSALQLVDDTKPHVVTIDLSLKDGTGLDPIRRIAARDPSIRMVACSLFDETLYAERALHAGAMGYVNKDEAAETIVKSIRRVLDGKTYLSDRMSDLLARRLIGKKDRVEWPVVDLLSNRELEVFELIGNGLTTAEIARKLHVGMKTVDTHRRRIKDKLNLKTTAQLASNATQWVLENG